MERRVQVICTTVALFFLITIRANTQHITILNMTGEVVFADRIRTIDTSYSIPTGGFPAGVYIVHIGSGVNRISKRLLVK